MKIVHVGNASLPILHPLGGAIERRIREIAAVQAARGHSVTVYSAGSEAGQAQHRGVEIRGVACRLRMPLRDFEFMRRLRRDIQSERPDVIHFHGLPEGAAFTRAVPAKKLLSLDYFIFRRGKKTPLFHLYRNMLKKFDCLLPVSEYCRQGFEEYWRIGETNIRILHNGVNLEQFRPDPEAGLAMRRRLGLEGQQVILYVGRVCHQKGTDVLIEAYRALRQRLPSSRLVVAGPAEQFATNHQTDLTRGVADAGGTYLGPVPESDLPAIYNMCDVFVMPTRSIEMFGMAAVEAQACGKPVVCSRHGGLTEVVNETSGSFFPAGDAAPLSESLQSLLEDDCLRRSKAESATQNASRFSWRRIADQLEEIYSSLRAHHEAAIGRLAASDRLAGTP